MRKTRKRNFTTFNDGVPIENLSRMIPSKKRKVMYDYHNIQKIENNINQTQAIKSKRITRNHTKNQTQQVKTLREQVQKIYGENNIDFEAEINKQKCEKESILGFGEHLNDYIRFSKPVTFKFLNKIPSMAFHINNIFFNWKEIYYRDGDAETIKQLKWSDVLNNREFQEEKAYYNTYKQLTDKTKQKILSKIRVEYLLRRYKFDRVNHPLQLRPGIYFRHTESLLLQLAENEYELLYDEENANNGFMPSIADDVLPDPIYSIDKLPQHLITKLSSDIHDQAMQLRSNFIKALKEKLEKLLDGSSFNTYIRYVDGFPNLYISLKEPLAIFNDEKKTDSLDYIFMSICRMYISYELYEQGFTENFDINERASFGYPMMTVAMLDDGFRIAGALTPNEMVSPIATGVAEFIKDLDSFLKNNLYDLCELFKNSEIKKLPFRSAIKNFTILSNMCFHQEMVNFKQKAKIATKKYNVFVLDDDDSMIHILNQAIYHALEMKKAYKRINPIQEFIKKWSNSELKKEGNYNTETILAARNKSFKFFYPQMRNKKKYSQDENWIAVYQIMCALANLSIPKERINKVEIASAMHSICLASEIIGNRAALFFLPAAVKNMPDYCLTNIRYSDGKHLYYREIIFSNCMNSFYAARLIFSTYLEKPYKDFLIYQCKKTYYETKKISASYPLVENFQPVDVIVGDTKYLDLDNSINQMINVTQLNWNYAKIIVIDTTFATTSDMKNYIKKFLQSNADILICYKSSKFETFGFDKNHYGRLEIISKKKFQKKIDHIISNSLQGHKNLFFATKKCHNMIRQMRLFGMAPSPLAYLNINLNHIQQQSVNVIDTSLVNTNTLFSPNIDQAKASIHNVPHQSQMSKYK
jgi:hypothetical protein